ncbi:MAG: sigma-70 family RNA polymerase sigma factor [Bryobacteraceae bacterium]|nr:sigma-70 family RNA polymerase sigma factor [Bryobacteraceae bacterium]MCX7605323.1 sigma-70 family RNA polymerase sigma factor [Bryobacteraceae bacterium]
MEGVRANDAAAIEELYRLFCRGIRFFLCRHLGPQDLDDRVHDTFLMVVHSIQNGGLREPERLMGFVRTIVRRQIATYIDETVQQRKEGGELELGGRIADPRHDPEQSVLREQRVELMLEVLRSISPRDREILTRFYLYEQTQEQICAEMGLTETQFRLLKSRAKARFAELGRRRLTSAPLWRVLRKARGA